MNEDKKIPVAEVRERLQSMLHYKDPKLAFRTLLLCWVRHPKYKSPNLQTLRIRANNDGFAWLKVQEIASFSNYCGYDLS